MEALTRRLRFGLISPHNRQNPAESREFLGPSSVYIGRVSASADSMADRERHELPLWFCGKSRNQDAKLHANFFPDHPRPQTEPPKWPTETNE